MLYRKNLFSWEQVGRLVLGGVAIASGALTFQTTNWLVIFMGAAMVVTGVFGFCPACYLVGRRQPGGRSSSE